MVIKPHHFMDIIKLYGGGIQVFVPDTDYGHDFYRAANEIIGNHRIQIKVTSGADDICGPCRFLGSDKTCTESVPRTATIRCWIAASWIFLAWVRTLCIQLRNCAG